MVLLIECRICNQLKTDCLDGICENCLDKHKPYKQLIDSANKVQDYIINSEMGGQLDRTDPFYRTWNGLEELKIKFEEEGE